MGINRSGKKICLFLMMLIVFVGGIFFIYKKTLKYQEYSMINISELSKDFMNDYFSELSAAKSNEEKENMLIIISNNEIENSYGAKNIIKAPNNQYILQYDSEETKNNALSNLKNDDSISSVEENIIYTIDDVEYNSWGVEKMSLNYAINNSDIELLDNVTVAIIDTGCDMNLFNKYYSSKIIETYNVLEESTTIMSDRNGHGTHIAGTIAESTPSNVKILPIKVSETGTIYNTDIIAAINYVTYNEKADVINLSFGSYFYSEAIDQAISAANEKNIISVAAAGNNNTDLKHYPSALSNTISISSVNSNLEKSSFSNYGADITFTAPGTDIKSIMSKDASISRENGNADGDDDHETISGTSMATPHAVSAVAILKSYNKDLTLDNVIELLKQNAIDLGEEGWDQYYGYGLISFENVQFCDGNYCDEYGVYKNLNKDIINIELLELIFTKYNYYSLTNLMGSRIKVYFSDGTNNEMLLGDLPDLEVLNYVPTDENNQVVTIKTGEVGIDINVTNPSNYEGGWEYNVLENNTIELKGYKSHDLNISRLYIPEVIDSKMVVSFADDVKFNEFGNDFSLYSYLYLPSDFYRIGNYSLYETNIKYIDGDSSGVEVGSHALELSSITKFEIPLTKIEDSAFKNCYELLYVNVSNNVNDIGNYAFYNCKKLLEINNLNDIPYRYVDRVGEYAFYNCIALSYFDLEIVGNIENYAFYNCFALITLDFSSVSVIGEYALYGSGIYDVTFGPSLENVLESSFENCRNLNTVEFTGGRIESRAFYNANIEYVYIGPLVEYIAEDAFAYTQLKGSTGSNGGSGRYDTITGLGIVDYTTNTLLFGFTDAVGASNTNIPDYISEIGNYAFTGNNSLNNITIPENIVAIGEYAFKDCYQLSNVYMLGNVVKIGNDTFSRTYEGEIKSSDLILYVYKDSDVKQYTINNNLNYRHIDPDEIQILNDKSVYDALTTVNDSEIIVKLIYNEEEYREEILTQFNNSIVGPISNGVGFYITYQNGSEFQFGDTYYTVNVKNSLGYEMSKNVNIEVVKQVPNYKIPTDLKASLGQNLSEITLPSGFEWMDANEIIDEVGNVVFKAKYVPNDTKNYEIVENIDITISVSNNKTIVIPNIILENKIYDGTTTISTSNITISNLETSEYSIVSAVSSDANVGQKIATIKVRLSDEKYEDFSFSDGTQEKEFSVEFEIIKANINVKDLSTDVTVTYDGKPHTIKINLEYDENVTVKYMDENNEYTLDKIPEYTEIGKYVIKYKVYINDNYTEYFGQKTLLIEDIVPYTINNYSVDEINKYISKIMVNTEINAFTSYIDLSYGYGVNVDYKEINNKKLLYTGGKTRITKDSDIYVEYTNAVIGDINGDGAVNSADLLRIRQHLLGSISLTGVYFLASDINYDETINSADLLRVRQHLLGTKPIS